MSSSYDWLINENQFFEKKNIKKEIYHLKTAQNKLTSKKFQLGFMIDPMGSLQRINLHA